MPYIVKYKSQISQSQLASCLCPLSSITQLRYILHLPSLSLLCRASTIMSYTSDMTAKYCAGACKQLRPINWYPLSRDRVPKPSVLPLPTKCWLPTMRQLQDLARAWALRVEWSHSLSPVPPRRRLSSCREQPASSPTCTQSSPRIGKQAIAKALSCTRCATYQRWKLGSGWPFDNTCASEDPQTPSRQAIMSYARTRSAYELTRLLLDDPGLRRSSPTE
jgi:hypothetical protein